MWAVCSASCSGLSYIDADPSCAGWAEAGECEKNPEFMLLTCNASCVRSVRRGGAERGGAHVNPNLLSGADRGAGADRAGGERTHRARTFLPIFLAIAALLAVVAGVQLTYAKELSARQEAAGDAWARKIVVLQRQLPWLAPLLGGLHIDAVGRGSTAGLRLEPRDQRRLAPPAAAHPARRPCRRSDLSVLSQRGAHRRADQPAAGLDPLGHAPLQRRRRLAGARRVGRHGQPRGRR